MKKKTGIIILIIAIILIVIGVLIFNSNNDEEVRTVKSEEELLKLYDGDDYYIEAKDIFVNIIGMPFSLLSSFRYYSPVYYSNSAISLDYDLIRTDEARKSDAVSIPEAASLETQSSGTSSTTKDFSTTNIQVENVDEADITKTDGDYIYSISENNVIITNVKNPEEIKIASRITYTDGSVPEDIILDNNKLVVILAKGNSSYYTYYSSYNTGETVVRIYDITSKEKPVMVKQYELNEPYYTSRCINDQLFVISCGTLKKENNKILRTYSEDGAEKEIALDNIKYLKDIKTRSQTIISSLDLNNVKADVDISSYLIDISNAYVSENSIYLLEQKYEYGSRRSYVPPISAMFGLKGVFGVFTYDYYDDDDDSSSGYKTQIFKFDIEKDGQIDYVTNTKVDGKTINQYSLDEKDGHLRVALYENNNGAKVVILNEKLDKIGESSKVGKGESMYSSRFMGDKVYVVTYRNTDPLYVIDLSDETQPKVLGELHIPGYSTYLHPYDETHLIGIGMQTEENVRRDSSGKVLSTTSTIVGMKMALFDVSDVNNPVQISETVIGDRRTTSAILTNPKALLFSKQRELIAIPVNNYSEDVDMGADSTSYSTSINTYTNYSKPYIAEGYFVYNINLTDGFKLKGKITHEKETTYYTYKTTSKLLRGLYIDDNLYTVSETAVKVNRLDTLEQISELKLKK